MKGPGVFVVTLVALAACTSLDNLSNTNPDAGPDAAPDAITPPPPTPPPADGGADADAGTFCERHPGATFCTDFDKPEAFALAGWSGSDIEGPGTIAIDKTSFVSSPHSLVTSIGLLDAGADPATARLELTFARTAKRTRVSFSVKMPTPVLQGGERVSIAEVLCQSGSVFDGAWLHWHRLASGSSLALVTNQGNTHSELLVSPTTFTRFELDATWGPSPSVVVRVEGVQVASMPVTANCPDATDSFKMVLGVSAGGSGVSASHAALYDDFLYEQDPP